MAFVNLPPNLQDIFYSITDRIAKLETGPNQASYWAQSAQASASSAQSAAASAQSAATASQVQAINAAIQANIAQSQATVAQSTATFAQSLAYAASAQATSAQGTAAIAQTTANGKNKVYYSLTTPGATANTAGDIWFQYSGSGLVIGQFVGLGGTSWQQQTITQAVIGTLDAGKITTGTLSAITITAGTGGQYFNVTAGGYMSAQGAYIKGNITADSGTFNGSLYSANGYFGVAPNYWSIGSTGLTGVGNATITAGFITGTTITGGLFQTSTGGTAVKMVGATNSIDFIYGGLTVGKIYPWTSNGIYLSYSSNTYPAMYVGALDATIAGSTLNSIAAGVNSNSINGTTYVYGNFRVESGYQLYLDYTVGTPPTAAQPNVYCSPTSQNVVRTSWTSPSSIRYKENITDVRNVPDLDPKLLLDIPVRAFTFKEEIEHARGDREFALVPGLIAEEVDAIYPVAAQYVDGEIETWHDRYLLPSMLALIQDLYKRIEILEGK